MRKIQTIEKETELTLCVVIKAEYFLGQHICRRLQNNYSLMCTSDCRDLPLTTT